MSSFDQTRLNNANREIVDLQRRIADESKREADYTKRSLQAQSQAARASSMSSAKSYISTAERYANDAQRAREKRADHSQKLAKKTEEAGRLQQRIFQADLDDRKKQAAQELKRRNDSDRRIRQLEAQLADRIVTAVPPGKLVAEGEDETYDVFISHASEDKADFVKALAEQAREKGLRVWYDEFSLNWGDKLRRSIDRGLSGSYFGVVVFSENFFKKEWPQLELDALLEKEIAGTGRILPIWHKITRDEIAKYAPTMSGTLALRSSDLTTGEIAEKLAEMVAKVRPKRSEPEAD